MNDTDTDLRRSRPVLLVDDGRLELKSHSRRVERCGYSAIPLLDNDDVAGPESVGQKITENDAGIIISDFHMVTMDGNILLDHVAEHYPHVSRVLISATHSGLHARSAQYFMKKPLETEDLRRILSSAEKRNMLWYDAEVLVVDDEPGMRRFMTDVLADRPYRVSTASNGEEALKKVNGNLAAVLTDNRMPGMSGKDLLERIVVSHPDTARFFMSETDHAEYPIAHHSFRKPLRYAEVVSLLDASVAAYVERNMPSGLGQSLSTK